MTKSRSLPSIRKLRDYLHRRQEEMVALLAKLVTAGNTTSLYTPTLDGLGAVGGEAHAIGEFVNLGQMVDRAALLAGLILSSSLSTGV